MSFDGLIAKQFKISNFNKQTGSVQVYREQVGTSPGGFEPLILHLLTTKVSD